MSDQIAFKCQLKQYAISIIEKRIVAASKAVEEAQQSANGEQKSSAGDKYETSRAMGHLSKEMHTGQLAAQLNELALLLAIPETKLFAVPGPGAFVRCGSLGFFIASGLGRQKVGDLEVYFVSPQAPLAVLLQGKSIGDSIRFREDGYLITEIF